MQSHQTLLYHLKQSGAEISEKTEDLETGVRPCSQLSELKVPDISRSSLAIVAQASFKSSEGGQKNIVIQEFEPGKVTQSTTSSASSGSEAEIVIQDFQQDQGTTDSATVTSTENQNQNQALVNLVKSVNSDGSLQDKNIVPEVIQSADTHTQSDGLRSEHTLSYNSEVESSSEA